MQFTRLIDFPTPYTLPALVIVGLILFLIKPSWPTENKRSGWLAWFCWLLPLAYTMTPSYSVIKASPYCRTGIQLSSWDTLLTFSEPALNVWLFIPAGMCVWLAKKWYQKFIIAVVLLVTPIFIEAIQRLSHEWLNRVCQYGDIINNMIGIAVGLTLGCIIWVVYRVLTPEKENKPSV